MKYNFPSIQFIETKMQLNDGEYCQLPKDYVKVSNQSIVEIFYDNLF